MLDTFLALLGEQMSARPELIAPITRADQDKAGTLVEGIEVDDDERFEEDFELP